MVYLKDLYISVIYALLIIPQLIWTSTRKSETTRDLDFRWSAWSEFEPCSRSCGIGIKRRHRTCYGFGTDPSPVTSDLCHGEAEQHRTCNTRKCPEGAVDFRTLQCSFFNGLSHKGRQYTWTPFYTARMSARTRRAIDPCALVCSAVGVSSFVVKFTPQVVDGTGCASGDRQHVCVKGQCQALGCDLQIGSRNTFDKCGVCNGDGLSCEVTSGTIQQKLSSGYRTLLEIEKGSRNIQIRHTAGMEATVALKTADGIFFLNDVNRRERHAGTQVIGGTVMYFQQGQNGGSASIRGDGPISEKLAVLGFTLEQESDIIIEYDYTRASQGTDVPESDDESATPEESYDWQTLLYHHMGSVGGLATSPRPSSDDVIKQNTPTRTSERDIEQQHVKATTETKDLLPVPKETTTPLPVEVVTIVEIITTQAARLRHSRRRSHRRKLKLKRLRGPKFFPDRTENEPLSSLTTDEGRETRRNSEDPEEEDVSSSSGSRARTMELSISVRNGARQVDNTGDDHEDYFPRTENTRSYHWRRNIITPCSSTCSVGTQMNFFGCARHDGVSVNDSLCDVSMRPNPAYHVCGRKRCQPRWVTGAWAPCSRTCGGGESVRSVRCWQMLAPGFDSTVHAYLCDLTKEPLSSRRCGESPCGPQWEVSEWQECSTMCGNGVQTRHVKCSSGNDVYCSSRSKPPNKRSCRQAPCTSQWYTVSWSSCTGPCGRGTRQRHVGCRDQQGRLMAETFCDLDTKPLATIACGDSLYCPPSWVAQPWGMCDLVCGTGVVTRDVTCGSVVGGKFRLQADINCKRSPRSKTTTTCLVEECRAQWFMTSWSECSETCGDDAMKSREVRCYYGHQLSDACSEIQKPPATKRCLLRPCPGQNDDRCQGDRIENCHLLVPGLCRQTYYSAQCCATCQRKTEQSDKEP